MENITSMEIDNNPVGSYAPDFELPGIDKEVYHLGTCLQKFKAIAVVFMANNHPAVDRYVNTLKKIQAEFKSQGFTLMGINSNHSQESLADSVATMKSYAQTQSLNFPYLRDPTQDVAKSFGTKVTPSVFLVDSHTVIRYAGKIDERLEDRDESITQSYLQDSIVALLAGAEIKLNYIEPEGTPIQWRTP